MTTTDKGALSLIDDAHADLVAKAQTMKALHKRYAEKWSEESKLLDAVRAEHYDGQAQAYAEAADLIFRLRKTIERKLT